MRVILLLHLVLVFSAAAAARELKIGLIPEQNVFLQVKRYEPIGRYIQQQTGVRIRFTILSRYGNIIDSFRTEKLDGAFWGSFTGALAIQKLGIEPIVRPLWLDGTSTYHAYLFARKESGITSTRDMKGKTIVFVERATLAGYVFPMAYLREHGIIDLNTFFKEHYFAGSHDAAIEAVLDKKADVGCAKNTIFALLSERDPRIKERIQILAESPKVPSNGLGIRSDLDPGAKRALAETLLHMGDTQRGREVLAEFGAIRFIATSKEDYLPVFDIAERAGINLADYEYVNQ